jgi:hypothetical protein
MPILVDGDNLLGNWRHKDRSDQNKSWLSFELARYGRSIRRRVVVYFDGPRSGQGYAGEARFSGHGLSADAAILDHLKAEPEPAGWTLVTSDRSLADRARHLGATTERSDQFRKRLTAPGAETKPETESDVEFWLERFGENSDEDDLEP